MNNNELRRFIESKTPNDLGIITIAQDLVFSEDLIINFNNIPVEFTGKTFFNSIVTFDGPVNFTFKNCQFKKIIVGQIAKIKLLECTINEICHNAESKTYNSTINYGRLNVIDCDIYNIELGNFFGGVKIENNRINTLRIGGSNFLDVEISGTKSKNSIKRFIFYGEYGFNDSKRKIDISNCIIGQKENSHPNTFAAKGLNINLTYVDFISDVELTQPFNTFNCDESVQFEKLNVRNVSKKISESSDETVLKGFSVKELCFLETYDKVILDQLNIASLKINEAKDLKTLNIKGCVISEFIVSSTVLKSLEIYTFEKDTKINLLKVEEFVEINCDAKDKNIEITNLEFTNCTIPKDKSLKFYNTKIQNLSFEGVLNYGNVIFTGIKTRIDGLLKIENSDLGKMIFMNCHFAHYKMQFESSKITEIFLAGTTMPNSENINDFDDGIHLNYENIRLAFTQLKKVFDNRGDSLNSTKFHKAELEVWENELVRQEEYWDLNIQNLEHKKLIYIQYKKMYEGRGDTVKAIEYQGKELNIHRAILRKTGGQFWERLQLFFNYWSNNFGQSWHWSVGWIFLIGLIFYSSYCFSLGFRQGNYSDEDNQRFWTLASYFFEFINPIRKGEFIKIDGNGYYPISDCARVIDFFWRIVITYLGYQLIQAFRKYSKKTS